MALSQTITAAADLRRRLGHPVIDGDGHIMEFEPALLDTLRTTLGAEVFRRYEQMHRRVGARQRSVSIAERKETRNPQGPWWGNAPAINALDRATAYLPKLLAQRLDELGFDFCILYGTLTQGYPAIIDEELRRGACRAVNQFFADYYLEFADRLTPAAVIPMTTPEEAIDELENAKRLGLKVVMMPAGVLRPIPAVHRTNPDLFPLVHWLDTFGVDSEYDYDPVWAKCRELGFAPTFHAGVPAGAFSMASRSVSNFDYNHVGSFAFLMDQICKSLVIGGVTRRFPDVTFGFLECGVGWAVNLLAGMVEHWEKRNLEVMTTMRNPALLNVEKFRQLHDEWGGRLTEGRLSDEWLKWVTMDDQPEQFDDWAAMEIKDEHDFYDLFVRNFYFGCEGDDRTMALAFSPANYFRAQLKPMMSSDIGHWDVLDMTQVLPDSYKLVEEGLITPEQYRAFVCDNPANLHLSMNPRFFDGTRVGGQVVK